MTHLAYPHKVGRKRCPRRQPADRRLTDSLEGNAAAMAQRSPSTYRIAAIAIVAALLLLLLAAVIKGLAWILLIVAVAVAVYAYLGRRRGTRQRLPERQS
jgi:lysylphosphatidylglycerol synthetase-like protein (DUF2156 family)